MEDFRLESPTCKHLTNPTWSCVDSRLKKAIEYRACVPMDEKSGIHTSCVKMSAAAAATKSVQSCPTLCDPIDGSPSGSTVPGIFQARTLEQVAISFSNAWKWKVSEVAQSCPTLSDSMGCSLPGSSVHGIFQARALEWGAIAFSGWTVYSWRFISRGKNKVSV